MFKINKQNFKKVLPYLAIVLIVIYIISIIYVSIQNDTFFDIKMGEFYVQNGVSNIDTFSIHNNLKYISHHFLVNIITYFVYNFFSFIGLYILEILLTFLLTYLLYKVNKLFIKSKKIAYFVLFIELFMLIPSISIRAQMYSYILFLLEIIFIENFLRTSKKKYLVFLSLLPIAIINFHAGVIPFYFIIIITYLFNFFRIKFDKLENDETIIPNLKYLTIPLLLGVVFIFINPFGIDLITYSFKTLNNSFINTQIMEFLPFNIRKSNCFLSFIYFAMFIISYIFTRKKIKLHDALLFCGTLFMSFLSIRHFAIFVITTIGSYRYVEDLLRMFEEKIKNGMTDLGKILLNKILNIMLVISILILSFEMIIKKNYKIVPKELYAIDAVNYIKENIEPNKKIFNDYFWGTLLMFNDIKMFIDSRCDLYTEEYNGKDIAFDYIGAVNCSRNYDEIMRKYDIDYVFINKKVNLYKNISLNSRYEKIYEDNISVIYEIQK